MLYQRPGLPEEDEIVLCKVTKLFPNSVFVDLLEYNRSGMVHISEVSPGRIRNLRDFVSIDRQIVCKVLKVDQRTGNIDLSLRRVNSTQRTEKLEEIKQELKAENLLSLLAKKLALPLPKLYQQVSQNILKEYPYLHSCFKDVVSGEADLEKLGLDKKIAEELTAAIKEKFKPPKIVLYGEIKLQTYSPDGIEKIKKVLVSIKEISPNLNLIYLGGGRYKFHLEDEDYKSAEKKIKQAQQIIEEFNDKISIASFERK